MTKTVTHIDCPKEWKSSNDWDSHRPLLYLALQNNTRPVCEMGAGKGSTKLLASYCKKHHHTFASYETNEVYAKPFGGIVTLMNDYNEIHLSDYPQQQGILFIDLAPAELRKVMIEKHLNHADVIIVHDSEAGAEYVYGMGETLSAFKYRLDYTPTGKPHTAAVSNKIDIMQWV